MQGKISVRITATIVFLCSFFLFLSGFILQRQSVASLQKTFGPDYTLERLEKYRSLNSLVVDGDGHYSTNIYEVSPHALPVAYVQQVKKFDEICNAIMILADLKKSGSRAQRVLTYPASWEVDVDLRSNKWTGSQQWNKQPIVGKGKKARRRPAKTPKKAKKMSKKKSHLVTAYADAQGIQAALQQRKLTSQDSWQIGQFKDFESAERMMNFAQAVYNVKLIPVMDETLLSPLHLFNMTDYSRVIYVEPIGMVLKNMDHLFNFAPGVSLAATRTYWEPTAASSSSLSLSPNLLVIEPSETEYRRVISHLIKHPESHRKTPSDQKSIISSTINSLYASTAMVLPQSPYELLSSEFRSPDQTHERYRGKPDAAATSISGGGWNPFDAIHEAYYVRFTDAEDGMPMPWQIQQLTPDYRDRGEERRELRMKRSLVAAVGAEPECNSPGNMPCGDRDVWRNLYERFAERRRDVCRLDLEPI